MLAACNSTIILSNDNNLATDSEKDIALEIVHQQTWDDRIIQCRNAIYSIINYLTASMLI